MIPELVIDEVFRNIIPLLTSDEYANLERSLRNEGCRDAILTWGNVIVDGHNRYGICRKWGIPFRVVRLSFRSREAAVSWICLNQLSRRNLTREAYKYLIGKRYDAEKEACSNSEGRNQYSSAEQEGSSVKRISTSRILAVEFNITHTTVERYGEYSRMLDKIEKLKPGARPFLLSGRFRFSQQELSMLSELPADILVRVLDRLKEAGNSSGIVPAGAVTGIIDSLKGDPDRKREQHLDLRIKDMPAYNPDAEMNGLMLTIPTWIGMISRLTGVPVRYASEKAKTGMINALDDLQRAMNSLRVEMEGGTG